MDGFPRTLGFKAAEPVLVPMCSAPGPPQPLHPPPLQRPHPTLRSLGRGGSVCAFLTRVTWGFFRAFPSGRALVGHNPKISGPAYLGVAGGATVSFSTKQPGQAAWASPSHPSRAVQARDPGLPL